MLKSMYFILQHSIEKVNIAKKKKRRYKIVLSRITYTVKKF